MLLPKAQQAAGQDNGENDARVYLVMQKNRQPGGEQKNEDDRTFELAQQNSERIRSLLWLQEIGAVAGQPPRGFRSAQSFLNRSELLEHLGCRHGPKGQRRLINHDVFTESCDSAAELLR